MKHLFSIVLVMLTLAAKAQQLPQPTDGTDCSNLFFKALLEEDARSLGALLSSDFTVVSFNGQTVSGEQLQQAVAAGEIVINSGILSGTSTKSYGDVAIITGQWNLSARISNNSFQGDLAYIAVCVRAGGTWKVTTVQLTPLRG
ncbi:nuclear transport factor 2 family protein [Dyadobacter sandarakinus]|uniref:Nuclear transport factor 2 family protein n=1 Tax=Dyadobacter sandarakinus TaxID=2747268 RepID=A0ABX7ICN9_9BACT|nr:nuclear transport factor 2 family protein [Dyadobacter sandarakinus]QRR02898.1 nuclear transport factor 2 family protein [Dyadobacter sandarakinus]